MKKIYYNKLIRDLIPQKISARGETYQIRRLTKKVFEKELLKKVGEEASALPVVNTHQELIDELADVMDVIDEIKRVKKISSIEIRQQQKKHAKTKGGFKKRIFLVWSSDEGYKTNERKGNYERK